jgi:uncharacterized membrane protein (Fun14 family)
LNTTTPHRLGGWSGILLAVATVIATFFFLMVGSPPSGTEELLRYLSDLIAPWSILVGVSVVADLLVLPFAYALYWALRDQAQIAAFAGCVMLVLFAVLDLTVRWTNTAALITLAQPWSDATTTEIEYLIAAAGHATAVLESFLLPIYVAVIPAVGVLLVSYAWLLAEHRPVVAYIGMAVGAAGILAVVAGGYLPMTPVIVAASLAAALWAGVTGYALTRLAAT